MEDYEVSYQTIITACNGVIGTGVPQWHILEVETGRLTLRLCEYGVNRLRIKTSGWQTLFLPQKKEYFNLHLRLMNSTLYFDTSSHSDGLPIDERKAGMDLLDGEKGKFGGAVTTLLHHQHDLLQHICPSFQDIWSCDVTQPSCLHLMGLWLYLPMAESIKCFFSTSLVTGKLINRIFFLLIRTTINNSTWYCSR